MFNCRSDIMLEEGSPSVSPIRRLIVGFDNRGVALEVIGVEEVERNRLVIIHAMKLQKKYYHLLLEDSNEL